MAKLIGTNPNQVPTNADLGTLAYQDYDSAAPQFMASRRNFMYNGDMRISQRATSFSSPQNYTLDRYKSLRYAAGGYTISQQTAGLPQFQYCLRAQRNSGDASTNSFAVNQPLEVKDSYALRGQMVTFSIYLRAGSDYSCSVTRVRVSYHTTSGEYGVNYGNFTVSTSNAVEESLDLRGQTTWKLYTFTGLIPASAVQVSCSIQADAFSGTAGSNDYVETTGWQLELGKVATPFEHRSYGEELALCQRYYYKMDMSNTEAILPVCAVWDTQNAYGHMTFPVTMRATPTFQYPGGTNFIFYSAGSSYTVNYISSLGTNAHHWGIQYRNSATNWTAGNTIYARRITSSAYVAFDAEL